MQEHYVQCQAHMQCGDKDTTILIYWTLTGFVIYLIHRNVAIWDQIWQVAVFQKDFIRKRNMAKNDANFTIFKRDWNHSDKLALTSAIHEGLTESRRVIAFLVKETEKETREVLTNNKDYLPIPREKELELIKICQGRD